MIQDFTPINAVDMVRALRSTIRAQFAKRWASLFIAKAVDVGLGQGRWVDGTRRARVRVEQPFCRALPFESIPEPGGCGSVGHLQGLDCDTPGS